MLRFVQSFLCVILIQIFANIIFAIFTTLLNLDIYAIFSNYYLAFILQNCLIFIVYFGLTFLFNLYFVNGYKYPYKAKILGFILIFCFLITFYLDISNLYFIRYFLYIHYPIGSFFRTITSTFFTFNVKLSLIISILPACLGIYIGNSLSILKVRLKKKQLSSLAKKS